MDAMNAKEIGTYDAYICKAHPEEFVQYVCVSDGCSDRFICKNCKHSQDHSKYFKNILEFMACDYPKQIEKLKSHEEWDYHDIFRQHALKSIEKTLKDDEDEGILVECADSDIQELQSKVSHFSELTHIGKAELFAKIHHMNLKIGLVKKAKQDKIAMGLKSNLIQNLQGVPDFHDIFKNCIRLTSVKYDRYMYVSSE
mmetsp:Transcript_39470/g.35229  ORF Transcript_39470/g.35229 Transcript_39470/m.35229 type:complete len:198 (+) Transcript_39470:70-663(+)